VTDQSEQNNLLISLFYTIETVGGYSVGGGIICLTVCPPVCRRVPQRKGRFPLPEFTGRVDGPRTRVHFLTPVNWGRQLE